MGRSIRLRVSGRQREIANCQSSFSSTWVGKAAVPTDLAAMLSPRHGCMTPPLAERRGVRRDRWRHHRPGGDLARALLLRDARGGAGERWFDAVDRALT